MPKDQTKNTKNMGRDGVKPTLQMYSIPFFN